MSYLISTIIVEDNFTQRRKLEELISKYFHTLKVVASCSTFKQAKQAIMEHRPQLWLLDVQLDGDNISIPLLELGAPGLFEVVFITAEREYVLQNLLSQACAILVKPYSDDKLVLALNKALHNITLEKIHGNYDLLLKEFRQPEHLKEKIAFRKASSRSKEKFSDEDDDLIDFIYYKDLMWLHSAADHTTNLYCMQEGLNTPECLPATRLLGEWEEMLKGYGCFERISRSVILNLQYVTGYNKSNNKIKIAYSENSSNKMEFEVEASYKISLLQHYNSVIKNPF